MPQEVIERVHVLARRNPTTPPTLQVWLLAAIAMAEPDAFDAANDNKDADDDSTDIPSDQEAG